MNPGLFKQRITIQSSIESTDGLGQITQEWQDVHHLWAMIKTVQGREYFAAAATQNENTTRFVVRYTTGISPDMRIQYKDRLYDIESVINDDEANKTLTIVAKGRV